MKNIEKNFIFKVFSIVLTVLEVKIAAMLFVFIAQKIVTETIKFYINNSKRMRSHRFNLYVIVEDFCTSKEFVHIFQPQQILKNSTFTNVLIASKLN